MGHRPWGSGGKHRQTLTWAQSHSKAVAWPMTSVDRLEEAEVSGLPSGPQEPWSSDEGGFLRSAAARTEKVTTIINYRGEKGLSANSCSLSTPPPASRPHLTGSLIPLIRVSLAVRLSITHIRPPRAVPQKNLSSGILNSLAK